MIRAPAREILDAARATNERLGHENLGFLSESHGFTPTIKPLLALPPAYQPWDEAAAHLPHLWRERRVRTIDPPLLSADDLPDASLLRAATVLGVLAHAYYHCEETPPPAVPASIIQPWEAVNKRLGRPNALLSYIDLVVYNSGAAMTLLVPTVDNQEERLFYGVQFEMLARSTPIVGSVVRAQEAALQDNADPIKTELALIADTLRDIAHHSLSKLDPNEESPSHVNPVVWAKTVATLGGPIREGETGASGAAWPTAHVLDAFFGRRAYDSVIGETARRQRAWYPRHWRTFVDAVAEVSISEHVARMQDVELRGLYHDALQAYAGESGLLSRHRLKVYGFLDPTFRLGRAGTTGGAVGHGAPVGGGAHVADEELAASRAERHEEEDAACHFARLESRAPEPALSGSEGTPTAKAIPVTIDIANLGIRYRAGDRCQVLPEHSDELVEKTLRALHATGDEPIRLNDDWRRAVALREGYTIASSLPLRTLLRFGHIRPVERATAKLLHSITGSSRLHRIIESRSEDQYELWEVVGMLAESGFNPRTLWRMHAGERESICRVVKPESFRTYSIASIAEDHLRLTVGPLRYGDRKGTASNFLASAHARSVSIRVTRPPRFSLPDAPAIPVVMFAGGTGLAPFRGFILERERQNALANTVLFLSVRSMEELCDGEDLERAARGGMRLHVVATRAEGRRIDDEMRAHADAIAEWIARGAHLYICGRTGFSRTVIDALDKSIVRRLVGDGRLHQEVFTTYTGAQTDQPNKLDASEIALHNDDEHGYWMVISGRVYDVTEFQHLHPGGGSILRGYAGMDATAAYRRVLHHVNPEVDAILGMYEIGVVRRLDFGSEWGVAIGARGLRVVTLADLYKTWVRSLYAAVEHENTSRWGTPPPRTLDPDLLAATAGLCSTSANLRGIATPAKAALREGVRVFEDLERDTLRRGGERLLGVLSSGPGS